MRRRFALMLLLLPAACAPAAPPPTLPAGLGPQGGQTNQRYLAVGREIAGFFSNPQPNQPAAAARAIAELEWLADALPRNPIWGMSGSSVAINSLRTSRWEARRALGIPERAQGQAVINGLDAAARAIDANDQAALARALPRGVFPLGPQETVRRLSAPPQVPDILPALSGLSQGPTQGVAR